MQRATRLKLDTVRRILEFCLRHPDVASPTIALLVARLERLSATVHTLLDQQLAWHQEITAARAERDRLAFALRPRLNGLIRLADAAAAGTGDPTLRLTECRLATSPGPFLPQASTVLAAARDRKATLVEFGMPPKLLGEVQAELAACEAANLRAGQLAQQCAAAAAELETDASQALQALRHLDALNALRYAANPFLREEWERAAAVAWPGSRQLAVSS